MKLITAFLILMLLAGAAWADMKYCAKCEKCTEHTECEATPYTGGYLIINGEVRIIYADVMRNAKYNPKVRVWACDACESINDSPCDDKEAR